MDILPDLTVRTKDGKVLPNPANLKPLRKTTANGYRVKVQPSKKQAA